MLFQIKVNTLQDQGELRLMKAHVLNESADQLRSYLGTFKYYHFLRDIFKDISEFIREGDIGFCKPSMSDLCISWRIQDELGLDELDGAFRKGLQNICCRRKENYWEKYNILSASHFGHDVNIPGGLIDFTLSFEIDYPMAEKKVVNAETFATQAF